MKVIFTRGLLVGNVADFRDPLIRIGRGEENELCLMTDGVSRRHGELRRDESGRWLIRDLASTNGIKVNGVRISGEIEVREGDDIEIGEQCMRIDLSDEVSSSGSDPDGDGPAEVKITMPIPEPLLGPSDAAAPEPKAPSSDSVGKAPAAAAPEVLPPLFRAAGSKDPDDPPKEGDPAGKRGRGGPRRIIFSIVFYIALAIVVVGVIRFCINRFSPKQAAESDNRAAVGEADDGVFIFRYERVILSRDNIFRFSLVVENNTAHLVLDDIKHRREVRRKIEDAQGIRPLKTAIRASDVVQLDHSANGRERQAVRRRLTVILDGKFRELEVDGETVPPEIERVEEAVDEFAGAYGLRTISLTPEQLRTLAEESFLKAQDLYDNREADYRNLREAIQRYAQTVSYLEQFSPRPALWKTASERLAEAKALRKQRFKELNFELTRQRNLRDVAQQRILLKQIMDLVDPDTKQYEQARRELFRLDNAGRKRR